MGLDARGACPGAGAAREGQICVLVKTLLGVTVTALKHGLNKLVRQMDLEVEVDLGCWSFQEKAKISNTGRVLHVGPCTRSLLWIDSF